MTPPYTSWKHIGYIVLAMAVADIAEAFGFARSYLYEMWDKPKADGIEGLVDKRWGAAPTATWEDGKVEWYVPWMDTTIVRRADGTPARFQDIAPGMALDVAGFRRTRATTPTTPSAVRVTILDATPLP